MISGKKQTYGMMAFFLSVAIFVIFAQANLFISISKVFASTSTSPTTTIVIKSPLPDGTVLGAATENGTVDESAGGSTQTLVTVLGIILVLIFSITMVIYKRSQKKSENS